MIVDYVRVLELYQNENFNMPILNEENRSSVDICPIRWIIKWTYIIYFVTSIMLIMALFLVVIPWSLSRQNSKNKILNVY